MKNENIDFTSNEQSNIEHALRGREGGDLRIFNPLSSDSMWSQWFFMFQGSTVIFIICFFFFFVAIVLYKWKNKYKSMLF